MMHETIKKIRIDKGLSQKEVANGFLSQSNYSKYENGLIDIPVKAFVGIINNLNISFDEVFYINNNFKYSDKEVLFREFFRTPINSQSSLNQFIQKCEQYLHNDSDKFIQQLLDISIILKDSMMHKDIYYAKNQAGELLKAFGNKETLYERDIYIINSLLFLFPIETARFTMKYIENGIEKYQDFHSLNRIYINLLMNYSLMLIKEKYYEEALATLEQALPLAKKYKLFVQIGLLYIRKGICHQHLNIDDNVNYMQKGLNLLEAIEEMDAFEYGKVEISNYANEHVLQTN